MLEPDTYLVITGFRKIHVLTVARLDMLHSAVLHVQQHRPQRPTPYLEQSNNIGGIDIIFPRSDQDGTNNLIAPVQRLFTWGGVELLMELDTGTPVCAIPKRVYEEKTARWPRLQNAALSLSYQVYNIPIKGKLSLKVRNEGCNANAELTVFGCNEPSLVIRDVIRAFGLLPAQLFSLKTERGDLDEVLAGH